MKPGFRRSLPAVAFAVLGGASWVAAADDARPAGERSPLPALIAQAAPEGRDTAIDSSTAPIRAGRADNRLYAMTANDLKGRPVADVRGRKVGEVSKVVSSRDRDQLHAVIALGGQSAGGREVAAALDELELQGDELKSTASSNQMETRPAYTAEEFVEVRPSDRPLSEFSAFEAIRQGASAGGSPGGEIPRSPGEAPFPDAGRGAGSPAR